MTPKMEIVYNNLLEEHGLRRTNFRKEVLSIFFSNKGKALTNSQLEQELNQFDRITLYRTLRSFEKRGLIHQAIDSKGQTKYALCGEACDVHDHSDGHAHFHCTKCGETRCMDNISKSMSDLVPKGYQIEDIQITLSGICETCHR